MAIDRIPLVNRRRLAQTFQELAQIDSPSREEGALAERITEVFAGELNAEVQEDESRNETGSESGNLIVRLSGDVNAEPLFFNAHLDTVKPGRGVRVQYADGIFRSDGTTVLGADDKAAVAILIETARILRERDLPHGPLEFVFTVCEEIGLLGAKALDPALLTARQGYALDSTDSDIVIHKAPMAIRFHVRVLGRAAHAGLHPEQGINAIRVAAEALAEIPLGRIDEETTANVGLIHGGKATNIVPEEVMLDGEVRSHNPRRLGEIRDQILGTFHRVAETHRLPPEAKGDRRVQLPAIQVEVTDDYPLMSVPAGHPLITLAGEAASAVGRTLRMERTGGGSDANIFNGKGLATVILGIGMQKVHSTEEFIELDDMVTTAELVLAIVKRWGERHS